MSRVADRRLPHPVRRVHQATREQVVLPTKRVAIANALGWAGLLVVVAASAIVSKELVTRRATQPLVALDAAAVPDPVGPFGSAPAIGADPLDEQAGAVPEAGVAAPLDPSRYSTDLSLRWFNGRPVRAARTIWMTVTAYSPDERSCAGSADDITASLHHVQTNGFRLVAADTRILPLGSMLTIPGYGKETVVPVLDRGGKIKGYRLDVLFPTHEQARAWGVKKLPITVWEYADGKPADNWRKIRDSKR